MKINKNRGTFVRLTDEELNKLHILKKEYAINISALFRNTINISYTQLTNKKTT